MVCEYTLFNFPGCGCPALVPLRFCPEHLNPDPKNICYQEGRDAAQNPARITMLFGGPAQPISLQIYERMCNLYKTPLLAKDPKLSDKIQQQSYERLAKLMMNMQKHTVDWHDGGTVKAGFHTKLTRYHVIYPSCGNMRLERPADEKFWPFAETRCIEHSDDLIEDKVNNKWTFAPRPQLELFNEPFEHRFNAAIATYKPTDENNGNQSDDSDSSDGSEEPKTGGGYGKKKKENKKANNGKKNESGSEYQGTETEGSGEESGPKGKKEVEGPAKKNNGGSKENKPQGGKQEHEVVTSTNTIVPVPKKKPAAKRKPKKDDDGEWEESGEDETDEDIEEGKGGKNNGKKPSNNKKDTTTTETKPKAEGSKSNPNSKPTNNGPKKPNTNPTNRNNEDNNANQGNDEDTNDEDELSEAFTEMSPKGPKTQRRPKRGEEKPEFSGLRRVVPSHLDEVGSGLRLYRALGNYREPKSSTDELEQLNLPSTNQTIDDICVAM